MKRLIRYVKPYYGHIVLAALASFGCSVAGVLVIDILKEIIDYTLQGALAERALYLVAKAAAVIALGLLSNYLAVAMSGYFGAGILRDLRRDALNRVMQTSPDLMEKNNFGDMIERFSSDIGTIATYMQSYFQDCLYVPVLAVVFAVYMFGIHPGLATVCLLPLAVFVPLSVKLLKPIKQAQHAYVKELGLTNNNIKEAFDGVEVIKSYGLQEAMERKYYKALKRTFDMSNRNDLRQYNVGPLSMLIHEAPTAIALCVGGYLALQGQVTLGVLVAFISAVEKISGPLENSYQLVVRAQMAMVAVNRVFYLMDLPVEEETAEDEKSAGEAKAEGEQAGGGLCGEVSLELRDVDFAYASYKRHASEKQKAAGNHQSTEAVKLPAAITGLNIQVPAGKRIALVGRSGCGKSTILKLLRRECEADAGQILFNGTDYKELSPTYVRNHIGVITQDAVLFSMSVSDNIRIGKPDAGPEAIREAARLAGCHDFIEKMPNGYDTVLEEKGANLSGGQRQRLSIARAILKDAPVLLLDEPTSALDRETESYITETLEQISQNKTVVTVAHRLSTITDYDEIIVLEEGEVIERGTHTALLAAEGAYARMYREYLSEGGAQA